MLQRLLDAGNEGVDLVADDIVLVGAEYADDDRRCVVVRMGMRMGKGLQQ